MKAAGSQPSCASGARREAPPIPLPIAESGKNPLVSAPLEDARESAQAQTAPRKVQRLESGVSGGVVGVNLITRRAYLATILRLLVPSSCDPRETVTRTLHVPAMDSRAEP